jgi:hypothetical protein
MEEFRLKLEAMFKNNTELGGRSNVDEIMMLKSLFIQQLCGLSDTQLERELVDIFTTQTVYIQLEIRLLVAFFA